MLQELLFALVGYTGDLIINQREHQSSLSVNSFLDSPITDRQSFKLAPDINFLDPSDRDVIERIASLGFYYRELDRFATSSRNLSWIRSEKPKPSFPPLAKASVKPSLYRRAIVNGIVEVLAVYRSTILQIEQKFISEATPVLASLTEGLNKFIVLLPPLYDLVVEIEKDDIRGGQLLSFLHKRCHCGIPELQVAIQRLLWHGHQVMYSQLVAWMVYGILHDQHGEFFIKRKEGTDLDSSHVNLSSGVSRLSTTDLSLTDWQSGFHLYLEMLPDYIQIRIAESILFAGKAIRVLRNPSPNFQMNQNISRSSLKFQGFDTLFRLPKESIRDTNSVTEDLLPLHESDKIETLLHDLKNSSEFHKRSFESAVDAVQAIAASHLWQLVVVRADLNGHLRALKDYFLLAKGDFFQCFLEESRQLMRLPPRLKTSTSDLMVPFQLAAMKTISEEDKYFHRVSLRMPSFGEPFSELSVDGWDDIALEYSVDWPLHLFVSQEVLSKYLKVFQYLLRLKRTQIELEKSWASVMHQAHSDFVELRQRRRQSRPMWHVREHMAFLIKNLQFYIQVDVIESQWNILQSHIEDSHDFTELVKHHHEYLTALISQSFLDFGSVARILDGVMKLCLQFCWCLENHSVSSSASSLQRLAEEFYKKSNSLYTILRSSRVEGSQRAPSLRRFLLRLNFNSFFEATARGVLNIVGPVAQPASVASDSR